MDQPTPTDPYLQKRSCKVCDLTYTIQDFYESSMTVFDPPDDYGRGCYDHCLACWLGVGPKDFPPMPDDGSADAEITYPRGKGYSPDAQIFGDAT